MSAAIWVILNFLYKKKQLWYFPVLTCYNKVQYNIALSAHYELSKGNLKAEPYRWAINVVSILAITWLKTLQAD